MNLMHVSHNWATRPDDQRYLDLASLHDAVKARRESSRVDDAALDCLTVKATEDGAMHLRSETVDFGRLTHYAFGQVCQRVGAPASYLRSLPPALAELPLAYSLEKTDDRDAKILSRQNGSQYVAGITSPTYGRIWDEEVVAACRTYLDPQVWKVPAASYSQRDSRRATTLYASDRDVFLFLVSENVIVADGERVNRGIIVKNSEVGAAAMEFLRFTYDFVCDNRIVWGAKNLEGIKIRHTSGGPMRFIQKALPALKDYVNAETTQLADTIRRAKRLEVGSSREEVYDWLNKRGFTRSVAKRAYDAAEADPRSYNPRTVWGLVQGITDVAHDITYQDARTDLETKAGSLLDSIAA